MLCYDIHVSSSWWCMHVPRVSANKAYKKIVYKNFQLFQPFIIIPSSVLVTFVDMNMYILTERGNFKTFWKAKNYAIGLDSCYLFNLKHGTEHDIVNAYGVCMDQTFLNFMTDEFGSLLICNIIKFFFNCLWGGKFLTQPWWLQPEYWETLK